MSSVAANGKRWVRIHGRQILGMFERRVYTILHKSWPNYTDMSYTTDLVCFCLNFSSKKNCKVVALPKVGVFFYFQFQLKLNFISPASMMLKFYFPISTNFSRWDINQNDATKWHDLYALPFQDRKSNNFMEIKRLSDPNPAPSLCSPGLKIKSTHSSIKPTMID